MTSDILRAGGPPAKYVGRTEGKSVFLGTIGVRHIVDKVQAEGVSPSSSIRCHPGRLPQRFIATTTKMSTAGSSRDA